ncbi:hypothetical protein [Mycolicibacterium mageritense]|uniref:hypothetical protein n=1 Tax=Mycolicibacterium mageritense TaxID=53462 RepID=UPI001E38DF8D|nr:hypothetical protein [Mycolicibacterium mageritense]GJJ23924.1 hypothetical protein MTY414_75980 [Mycolicibacterium mageritense]
MSAGGYVSQIDRLLASAVSVFPDPSRGVEWVGLDRPTIAAAPADGGQLAEALDQATDTYARMAAETEAVQAAIRDAAQSAAETARQAAIDMASIRETAQSQGTAIMPGEDLETAEPHDLKLLVETMDSKLEAAQDVLGTTRENFERSAEQLRAAYL